MKNGQKNRYLILVAFLLIFTGLASAGVTIEVVSDAGDDIDNFDITVSSDGVTISRDNIDVFERNLEEGDYTVEITKDGYPSIEKDITIEDDSDADYTFSMEEETADEDSDISITRVNSPEMICRGESFSVDFDIRNNDDSSKIVSTSGSGFGKILSGKSFVVEPDQTKTYRFVFTDVRGVGEKEFRVSVTNSNSDSETGDIQINECGGFESSKSVDDIDVNLYPVEGHEKASVGELVRVKGFADGARGAVELNLSINGERLNTVQTHRDGYFQTFFRPESSGLKTLILSTPEIEVSETLNVVPKPEIGKLESRSEVFEGEEFEICGNVKSSIFPKVVLLENGDVKESRQDNGKVCFDVRAPEKGEYTYEMRVLTYGNDDSSSKEVEVLEQGPEAESFPGQISTVETDDGLVRVEIYNTGDRARNYTAELDDLPSSWVSESSKSVSLSRGERDSIYFYLSPRKSGEMNASLTVEQDEEEIYRDSIKVYSTNKSPKIGTESDFFGTFINLLKALF